MGEPEGFGDGGPSGYYYRPTSHLVLVSKDMLERLKKAAFKQDYASSQSWMNCLSLKAISYCSQLHTGSAH